MNKWNGKNGLGEVDGVQHLHAVAALSEHFAALDDEAALGICHDIRAVQLHQVGLQPEPRFTGTGSADDQNIFVPGVLWFGHSAFHGQAFCFCQDDVLPGIRVHKRDDICMLSPTSGTEFLVFAELFSILALNLYKHSQRDAEDSADQQIKRMKTWKRRLQSSS